MQESSVFQHFYQQGIEQGIERGIEQGIEQGMERGMERGIERGREEGTRESLIEGILETLELRFNTSDISQVASVLQQIHALPRLKGLRREALQAASLAVFQAALHNSRDTNGNQSA